MCLATPQAQVTPTNPAPYAADKAYGAVRTYKTDLKTGKREGGGTVAEQHQAEVTKSRPSDRSGVNLRM